MRKVALLLVCFFLAGGFASAQGEFSNFVQEGRATWGTVVSGMQAAHPSLPIGSTPTIMNPATGREAVVTVTGRIMMSTERAIDLSAEAASALGLPPQGGPVVVHFPSASASASAPPPHAPPSQMPASSSSQPGSQSQSHGMQAHTQAFTQSLPQGVSITIHNYVIPRSSVPEWMEARMVEEGTSPAGAGASGFQASAFGAPFAAPPPPPQPRVTPGLPDPNSDRTYRLRVGSWPSINGAIVAFLQLRDADFYTIQEYSHGEYRVYAAGIPAREAVFAVQRLGGMGFMDIHITAQ